ncbi:MAG: 3-hexulose-6-phosphate synthase [Anaerolineae bacterium]
MKLQLALDGELADSLALLQQVHPYLDIAEIGTPLLYREGVGAVRQLRQRFPALPLLADLKIMDAGAEEAAIAFEAGADLVTVLAVAHDSTIAGAVKAARRYGRQVLADMMQVPDMAARAWQLLALGCDYLCVHTAFDQQSTHETPLAHLRELRQQFPVGPLAAAGGIKLETLDAVLALRPEIVVVGGAITRAANPPQAARAIYERIHADENLR